jgi:hypothetical protein
MIFRFLKKKKTNKKNIDIASESDLFKIKIKKPISYITQIQVLYQGTSFIHVNLPREHFSPDFAINIS